VSGERPSAAVSPKRSRRWLLVLLALLLLTGGLVATKYGRYYFLPKRLAVVEPGRLYRSGYCQPGPLTRVLRNNGIRTILTLLQFEPDSRDQQREEEVARKEGVRIIRIGMPGDGCAAFDLLDKAADTIADPANYPLLVHCYAGTNRTGAAYAAWRMKHCGWSYEQALAEGSRHNLSNPKLCEHLKRYYEERVRSRPGGRASCPPSWDDTRRYNQTARR
jgi:hypothetical protein